MADGFVAWRCRFDMLRVPGAKPDGRQLSTGHRIAQLPPVAAHRVGHRSRDGEQVRRRLVRLALILDQPDASRGADLPESPLAQTRDGLPLRA